MTIVTIMFDTKSSESESFRCRGVHDVCPSYDASPSYDVNPSYDASTSYDASPSYVC